VSTDRFEFSARPNEPVVEISRWFPSPPAAVFEAWATPEHVCHWWGPANVSLVACDVDLRVGGAYRYEYRAPDGRSFSVNGRFVEIDPPSRLVTNFTVDITPGDEVVEVTSFDPSAGGTVVRIVSLHRSSSARDAQLADGSMQAAVEGELSRLDEVLARSEPA
jgi:uncharacterized protein YndB with AHSA1/START domain